MSIIGFFSEIFERLLSTNVQNILYAYLGIIGVELKRHEGAAVRRNTEKDNEVFVGAMKVSYRIRQGIYKLL